MAISRKVITEFVLRVNCDNDIWQKKHKELCCILRSIADDLETTGGLKSNVVKDSRDTRVGDVFFHNARRAAK